MALFHPQNRSCYTLAVVFTLSMMFAPSEGEASPLPRTRMRMDVMRVSPNHFNSANDSQNICLDTADDQFDGLSSSVRSNRSSALARRFGLGTVKTARQLLKGAVQRKWSQLVGGLSGLPSKLVWPVEQGKFTRGFGTGRDGYHLAVDILARTGTRVRAAAGGLVAYVGRGLRGYGNTIMIIHPGGSVTLYAHNARNYVHPGQRVESGDAIGEVGSTGIARGPHTHFELIYQGQNCNPTELFKAGKHHRSSVYRPNVECSSRKHISWSRWSKHT